MSSKLQIKKIMMQYKLYKTLELNLSNLNQKGFKFDTCLYSVESLYAYMHFVNKVDSILNTLDIELKLIFEMFHFENEALSEYSKSQFYRKLTKANTIFLEQWDAYEFKCL